MKQHKIKLYTTLPDRIMIAVIWIVLILIFLVILIPLIFVVSSSFSSASAVSAGKVFLLPVEPSLAGYNIILHSPFIIRAFLNSIAYTIVGTIINVMMTLFAAYPLSRRDLKIRGPVMFLFTVTMFFGGGMIPTYLVVRNLHLTNTFWAMVIPGAMGVWNVILTKTYIQSSIPDEIYESASIDGCSDWRFLVAMVIPLSVPILAVMVLLYAVGHWNDFYTALLYLNDQERQPLQMVLRSILVQNTSSGFDLSLAEQMNRQEMKTLLQYSLIIVSTVPVLILYPFIQKYFIKGIMVGSIKG